jgi:hypothetical protein
VTEKKVVTERARVRWSDTMLMLIKNGGFPMFFILAFGGIGLATSAWYAYRPNPRGYGFILWIGAATFFTTLMGLAAALGATGYHVARAAAKNTPDWQAILVEGCAESMSAPIMGFSFLALTALLVAVGKARDPRI